MEYRLTPDTVKVLTWCQWSGSISEGRKMFWTGGIIQNPVVEQKLRNFFGGEISYFEKISGKIHETKVYKSDKKFVTAALCDGWLFGCGHRRVPKEVLGNKNLFVAYLRAVCDSVGHFLIEGRSLRGRMKFTIEAQHREDFTDLTHGIIHHGLPSPHIYEPITSPDCGLHMTWNRKDMMSFWDFLGWKSDRKRNADAMRYIQEDRNPLKRQFS